ncbi:sugar transferase [Luteolibacter yonseiensis]|uniref:Sugar transferase n=1 Tax=Luteolibacter yonseiensis TaxID=1144680 RepID=A0A934R863_9BACT|nr:sugar transferase [Luteolibacter yonseiensis]MBK1817951.1 sugar transferase [Luteolibacter yonseiensis]
MSIAPEEYWSQAGQQGKIEKWSRNARRKMAVWRFTILLARVMKRGIDVVGSIGALMAFSPIIAATALLIRIEDGGPIFFRQNRVGAGGKLFGMWKFRSMVVNADKIKDNLLEQNQHGQTGVTFKMKNDPRITKVGKWIRKLSIDEFPQFYNVLRGDMSLVGPRPPLPREVATYKASHLRRLRVKPGITCLWQIGGRSEIDFEGQVRLDLEYIRSSSAFYDISILLKTLPAVLFGKGAY